MSQRLNLTAVMGGGIGILVASVFFIGGCVTREDIRGIQTDLYHIQQGIESKLGSVEDQTSTVQVTQSDLRADMRELSENIAALQAELQDSRSRVSELSRRLDDVEVSLKSRLDAQIELLTGSKFVDKPLPSTLYNLANTDFVQGRYPDAIKGFKTYIKEFPQGEMVPQAMVKIGDGYSKQKEWSVAVTSYKEFVEKFPEDRLVPTAYLRMAKAYESLNRKSTAEQIYSDIIKKYPARPEARTAQETLQSWKVEENE